MFRRNLPMIVAACGSLAVHALFFRETRHVTLAGGGLPVPTAREGRVTVSLADVPSPQDESPDDLGAAEPPPPDDPPSADPTPPPSPPPHNTPAPADPPPPPKPAQPKPKPPAVDQFPDLIGEMTGKGTGTHAADGDVPLRAREADADQPFLSRDARGPGRVGNDPSKSLLPPGEGGTGEAGGNPGLSIPLPPLPQPVFVTPLAVAVERPPDPPVVPPLLKPAAPAASAAASPPVESETADPQPQPSRPESPAADETTKPRRGDTAEKVALPAPPMEGGLLPRPVPPPSPPRAEAAAPPAATSLPPVSPRRSEAAEPAPPQPPPPAVAVGPVMPPLPAVQPSPPPPAAASGTATGDGRRPGPPTPAADPAQPSDSESDPFARVGTIEFLRDGKLDVQFGRKIKTVRPRIPIVGRVDALSLRNPSVTLKVNIDASGRVTAVRVHKSSGSNEIDQPCLLAMYEWWFEPLKDKSGRPIPDSLLFTLNFR